jgi:4-aminobutyrate aminotransferase-like enzyme
LLVEPDGQVAGVLKIANPAFTMAEIQAQDGRVYLDMVNNVAVLGHSHPRIEAAAARQLRRLNTNSRFNYASVVEFSERLAGLLPEPLDTVYLVNSGSEAVDLAIRLALVATGHRDVVAVREAYHWPSATGCSSSAWSSSPPATGCACSRSSLRYAWISTEPTSSPTRSTGC